jgi:peptide/nickel transport system substrate-binding protein
MAGLTSVPKAVKSDQDLRVYNLLLTAAVMTFFKTSEGVLSDVNVRQALVQATNDPAVIQNLGYPTLPVREPLLQGQLAYNPAYAQASYNPVAANALLAADGWVMQSNGIRYKAGKPLSFALYTENNSEYATVANELQKQWRAVGADVQVILQNNTEFEITLSYHSYDALLYGISIGKDPDVFVYWDSKYAGIGTGDRLNFSEYSSAAADDSLEEGRTRSNPALRVIKYEPFLQAWQTDAPAVGLYQPRFLYITHGEVFGLSQKPINADEDRFDNVQNWMIRQAQVSEVK